MRIFSAVLLLALAACGSEPPVENKVTRAQPDDRIECALGGADYAAECAIERGDGTMLTLRHNDGGFRRFTLDNDGTIDTADGAEVLTVRTLGNGGTEITVGADRYRLPSGL